MDSDEEPEIKPRQSFRNTNNNTNHPKDTIIEEEESDDSAKKEPRKLACSFLGNKRLKVFFTRTKLFQKYIK
jgi:hypothetical protein